MSPEQTDKILRRIPVLPDTAILPVAVVAVHDGVSERTVRRNYPLVKLTAGRYGVLLGFLRHRRTPD